MPYRRQLTLLSTIIQEGTAVIALRACSDTVVLKPEHAPEFLGGLVKKKLLKLKAQMIRPYPQSLECGLMNICISKKYSDGTSSHGAHLENKEQVIRNITEINNK